MKIIGFHINKISAERKSPIKGKLEVKSNIDIKDIVKEEVNISNKPGLKFDFEFIINYEPKVAEVTITGSVLAIDDKDESKEILKEWKKKKFTHEVKLHLFNFILDKCNLKAMQLEDELSLPTHIPLPKIRPQQDQQGQGTPANYTG
jgi:hypothetical protein